MGKSVCCISQSRGWIRRGGYRGRGAWEKVSLRKRVQLMTSRVESANNVVKPESCGDRLPHENDSKRCGGKLGSESQMR